MYRRRCRNRAHVHHCRRHGRHHHHHHRERDGSQKQISPGYPRPRPLGQPTVVTSRSLKMDPVERRTVWEENSPDSLLDIAARYILYHPETYSQVVKTDSTAGKASHGEDDVQLEFDDELEDTTIAGTVSLADSPRSHNDSGSSVSAAAAAVASVHEVQPHQHRRPRRRRHRHRGLYDFDEEEEDDGGVGDDDRHHLSVKLRSDVQLPPVVCDKLFSMLHNEGLDVSDETAAIFADTDSARLRNISVRGSSISDRGLGHLLAHNPTGLDIHHCQHLRGRALELINAHSSNLVSLNIGNSVHILPDYIMDRASWDDEEDSLDEEDRKMTLYNERGYILKAAKLKHMVVKDLYVTRGSNYLELLLRPLPLLTHLDLSGLTHNEGLGDFSFLRHLNRLASLVLHNILTIDAAVDSICSLRTLRHLDISHSDDKLGLYSNPSRILARLVGCLPQLSSLDISGTNLAGTGAFESNSFDLGSVSKRRKEEDREDESAGSEVPADDADSPAAATRVSAAAARCDIPGLITRVDKPLDFLGLYKTTHEACCRSQIPAVKISGDSTEQQILVAGRQYLDRPAVLENVLNDLFHIFRYEICRDLKSALDIILMAMDRHPAEKVIQISGSASLYYIVKSEIRANINIKMKRKVLSTLLNGMFAHRGDPVMMRNGCLTLCQFSIPQDVVFDYERLVRILLHIVSEHTAEENSFVQRAGIYLLNSLACQVDGQQKLTVGNLGAMERMLALIRERVQAGNCDDVMETAWSCMWNVTDETPVNCRRFLDGGGMQLFLGCKERFPDKPDLLRNMMGLLGNVAEVPTLRPALMTSEFVAEFYHLLSSTSDGIEVSYNAAGVLAHMASDGPDAWTVSDPGRETVLQRMVDAIERWDLQTKRNINYRSFEPILRLVRARGTPECQHWAIWALANLTKVDPGKYCHLVEQEGGLSLLEEVINSNLVTEEEDSSEVPGDAPVHLKVLELAAVVMDNVNRWKREKQRMEALEGNEEAAMAAPGGGELDEDLALDG